jgi:hypothetical protein
MNIVKKIEAMAARLERAREIVKDGLIYPIYGDEEKRFVCKSHTGQQDGDGQVKLYLVSDKACTCADFRRLKEQNGGWCKHRLAREILLQLQQQKEEGMRDDAGREGRKHLAKHSLADGRGAGQARKSLQRRARGAAKGV